MSQEEQITEYNERIAAMEEELKKVSVFQIHSTSALCIQALLNFHFWVLVMSWHCEWCIWWILCLCWQIVDLFTDSKQKLDQCTEDLQDKNQRLEEAHKDLTETKHRLTQEEFIASQLQSNEVQLYSTADQVCDGRRNLIDSVCHLVMRWLIYGYMNTILTRSLSSSCWTLLMPARKMLAVSTLNCRGRRRWSFIMGRSSRALPNAWRTATTACRPRYRSRATNMLLWLTITALLWVRCHTDAHSV